MKKHYSAGSSIIAVRTVIDGTQDTLNWLIGDHLGSTSLVTDSSGAVVSEVRYSAFGEMRYLNGETVTDLLYTSQRLDSYINLYWYGSRWYDNTLGHFIQPDSIIPEPGISAAYDRYAYVNNNPLKYSDPSGHMRWEEQGGGWQTEYQKSMEIQEHKLWELKNVYHEIKDIPGGNDNFGSDDCYTSYYSCDVQGSNRWPDYVTLNTGWSIPGVGSIVSLQVGLTLDRYGNLYLGMDPSFGFEALLGWSVSLSGGYIEDWTWENMGPGSTMSDPPGEKRSEEIISGWFGNGSICFFGCGGLNKSLSSSYGGLEIFGIGMPQGAIGGGYSFLIDFTKDTGHPLWK